MQAVKGFACERGTKTAYKELKAELEAQLPYLPKHYLVDIRKQVTAQFVKRFKRSHIPKYGSLNKGFPEQEVGAFFRAIDSPKFHLLSSYQAQLGLRIGEAIRISLKDIRFESRELVVKLLISHGTRSDDGKIALENMMSILNTCRKNGVSFYHYVKDIFSKDYNMPRLAELIIQNSRLTVATSY